MINEGSEPAGVGATSDEAGRGHELEHEPELEREGDPEATDATQAWVSDEDLSGALEAVLLVVDSPVSPQALASAVDRPVELVTELLSAMARRLAESGSGIDLRESGDGWRFYTRDRFAPVVERFVLDGAQARLSRAALESLAVIAYRQPVTRARVAAVRGVNVDGVIRTLTSRGLIEEAGVDPDTGGQLFGTTDLFLDRMGLDSLEQLPPLGPLLPDIDALDDV